MGNPDGEHVVPAEHKSAVRRRVEQVDAQGGIGSAAERLGS